MATAAEIRDEFIEGAAEAFFADAWASGEEEFGEPSSLSRVEITDVMPTEWDPSAWKLAKELAKEVAEANKKKVSSYPGRSTWAKLMALIEESHEADRYADRIPTPNNFGFYAAMSSMGHGVGIGTAFGDVAKATLTIPHHEYGYYSFEVWPEEWEDEEEEEEEEGEDEDENIVAEIEKGRQLYRKGYDRSYAENSDQDYGWEQEYYAAEEERRR